jgi:hypothetical protein
MEEAHRKHESRQLVATRIDVQKILFPRIPSYSRLIAHSLVAQLPQPQSRPWDTSIPRFQALGWSIPINVALSRVLTAEKAAPSFPCFLASRIRSAAPATKETSYQVLPVAPIWTITSFFLQVALLLLILAATHWHLFWNQLHNFLSLSLSLTFHLNH